MVSGRPFISTTTYGLPVAAICCTSASCCPGRSSAVREDASPVSPAGSPTTTTVTSAACAAATAAPKPPVSLQGSVTVNVGHPGTVVTVAPGSAPLIPSATVTILSVVFRSAPVVS